MNSPRVRERTPEDDARITEIRSVINHDRPPFTVEEFRHRLSTYPPEANYQLQVVEMDGQIVGYASWSKLVHTAEKGRFFCNLNVDRSCWGRGVGSTLYQLVLRSVQEQGGERLYCDVRADMPAVEKFLRNRGFQPTGHADRRSQLDVRSANLDNSRQAAHGMKAKGIEIATLADLGPDDEQLLHAVHEIDNETARDVPGPEEWTSMPYEEWYREVMDSPGIRPDIFWIALLDRWPVGLAYLELRSGNVADNAYTCVDRRHRGKGIARALKYHTIVWCKENGVNFIYTGNDVENKPMLAINIELGYQPLPASVGWFKTLT